MYSKGVGRTPIIFILLLIIIPGSYIGLVYISATSAEYSISGVGLEEIPDPVEALISRELEIEFDLEIKGHGYVSTTVKSLEAQIYLEDIYMGVIQSEEVFSIPASRTSTAHMNFHLDLSGISITDIQCVIDSVLTHNGEIKMKIDGYVEPVILIFPINVPISASTYILTYSDAPKVTSLSWDKTSCGIGETALFSASVQNVFRGSSVSGVLDIIAREDVSLGSDINARTYSFPLQLGPGESKTFSGSFTPYKQSSTRGFFLKAQWGSSVVSEQSSSYPPRLNVIEGRLELEDAYWTVNNRIVDSCELGEQVTAHVIVRAYDAAVDDIIRIKIRKDIPLWPDVDCKTIDYSVLLNKGESREYTIIFTPDEPTGINLNGYFVEIEGDLSWTMPDTYPPRLVVESEKVGAPSVISVWWTTTRGTVTEVEQGENVQAHIRIKAINGDIAGSITIKVRKDIPLLPDQDHMIKSYTVTLSENQEREFAVSFSASDAPSYSFSGYFIEVDFTSWGISWTMDDSYPPRLNVREQITEPETGTPTLTNVWWRVNGQIVTEAQKGNTMEAVVRVKAVGGSIDGTITIRIRKDIAFLPDEDYTTKSYSVKLSKDQTIDLIVSFIALEKSGFTFRGYFVQVDFVTWGTSWTMDDSYPPRLTVN